MRIGLAVGVVVGLAAWGIGAADAADYNGPYRSYRAARRAAIGDCVRTRVEAIGPQPGGAAAIHYADGVQQAYDGGMLGQAETRLGDPIQLCLVAFTRDCGTLISNDQPGRTYATGNLRTGAAWTAPDTRSSCAAR
ncbi:hypothetical protein P7D22_15310 [Lichenihabitans sp. Uapishka_5]|uniref:hypothetical protein n=1 Tax=Lichenihabitans sp. Uapishka_5 TaxID=3037302 RepID=UPI0029E7F59B|nr:hypothetical protein [Lichenihabitans sp. Uapishka_5]MDX7952537.1 hypothetical protein [Lichenihabitans sp. Uapishka_5]